MPRFSRKAYLLPRKTDSNNPGDWIFFAESEIQGLETLAERELSYPMCQCKLAEVLEKVLKAELIRRGWFLERTHDLEVLANELESHRSDLVERVRPLCTSLAEVYFSGRYPGFDLDDADWPSFREKLHAVKDAIALVKARLSS